MFNKVTSETSNLLRNIVGEQRFIPAYVIGADYAHDEQPGGRRASHSAWCRNGLGLRLCTRERRHSAVHVTNEEYY